MDNEELELLEDLRLDLSRVRARLNMEADRLEELELKIEALRQKRESEINKMLEDSAKHDSEIKASEMREAV